MSVADGEYRKTDCPKGVSSRQSWSTPILMISHFMTEHVASYTQTIYVSQHSTMRAKPDKTQVTAFHLRNKETNNH